MVNGPYYLRLLALLNVLNSSAGKPWRRSFADVCFLWQSCWVSGGADIVRNVHCINLRHLSPSADQKRKRLA